MSGEHASCLPVPAYAGQEPYACFRFCPHTRGSWVQARFLALPMIVLPTYAWVVGFRRSDAPSEGSFAYVRVGRGPLCRRLQNIFTLYSHTCGSWDWLGTTDRRYSVLHTHTHAHGSWEHA